MSLQRRQERYILLHVRTILNDAVSNEKIVDYPIAAHWTRHLSKLVGNFESILNL